LPLSRYHEARHVFDALSKTLVEVRLVADVPNLAGLSLTTSNLLRHVRLRVEREEQLTLADMGEVETVLADTERFARDAGPPLTTLAIEIAEGLGAPSSSLPGPSHQTQERWVKLRWLLSHAIEALIEAKGDYRDHAGYVTLRGQIRAYLDRSLRREETLITEAFTVARR